MTGRVLEIALPFPPSVNHYWRHTKQGKHYISDEGKRFQSQVFMRESPEVGAKRRYLARLDDDTLAKVDKQVRKLDELSFKILFLRYVVGLEHKVIWRKVELCKPTYEKHLMLAEKFVEGALAGAEIKLFF